MSQMLETDRLDAELRARAALSPQRLQQEALERNAQAVASAHSSEAARLPGVEYQMPDIQAIDPQSIAPAVQPGI